MYQRVLNLSPASEALGACYVSSCWQVASCHGWTLTKGQSTAFWAHRRAARSPCGRCSVSLGRFGRENGQGVDGPNCIDVGSRPLAVIGFARLGIC